MVIFTHLQSNTLQLVGFGTNCLKMGRREVFHLQPSKQICVRFSSVSICQIILRKSREQTDALAELLVQIPGPCCQRSAACALGCKRLRPDLARRGWRWRLAWRKVMSASARPVHREPTGKFCSLNPRNPWTKIPLPQSTKQRRKNNKIKLIMDLIKRS